MLRAPSFFYTVFFFSFLSTNGWLRLESGYLNMQAAESATDTHKPFNHDLSDAPGDA